jgi:hypothetical protein
MIANPVYKQLHSIILLCLILGLSASVRAQPGSVEQPIPTYPTGSMLAFSKTVRVNKFGRLPVNRVYIRRHGSFDRRVWEMPALPVTPNAGGEGQKDEQGLGFIVPQLDRGRYDAWYGGADLARAKDSLTFDAVPYLLVENAISRVRPPSEVDVYVRIFSPKLVRKDAGVPERVSTIVTLAASDPSQAEIVSPSAVRTNDKGYARWRVRIKKAGIAELIASANQFEPAVLTVVGMPASGTSFWQAQLASLNARATELERSAAKANAADDQQAALNPRAQIVANQVGGAGTTGARVSHENQQIPAKKTSEGIRLGDEATRAALQAKAARAAAEAWVTASANEPRRISEAELLPGDVLLVLGSSTVSEAIRKFEQRQLGGTMSYSHASLYLGEFGGVRMVGEMWSTGFWITPLPVSVQGTRLVDVYRFPNIDDAKRLQLANLTANAFGKASSFIRFSSPSFLAMGSFLPYAFEEITLLGLAGAGSPGLVLTITIQNLVDPRAGGRQKMICSELVAWAYHDAGLELEVPYWKVLSDLNIFTSHERRHDYTTPNMLAHSKNLGLVGRYRGP